MMIGKEIFLEPSLDPIIEIFILSRCHSFFPFRALYIFGMMNKPLKYESSDLAIEFY
jgi:hypothetical protein